MSYTEEQKDIIYTSNKNIVVDALPGSGKTYTIIGKAIYEAKNKKKILILAHTKEAVKTFKERASAFNVLKFIDVKTIHSYAYGILNDKINNFDQMIIKATDLNRNKNYDYVIIDEAQDINLTQLKLIDSINGNKIFVGDRNQTIFRFAGANYNLFDKLLGDNYEYLTLSYTFRSSGEIVRYINSYMDVSGLKGPRLRSFYKYDTKVNITTLDPDRYSVILTRTNKNKLKFKHNYILNIHEIKGKEFNNIYLYFTNRDFIRDTGFDRVLLGYVAITRARKTLNIYNPFYELSEAYRRLHRYKLDYNLLLYNLLGGIINE